MGKRNAVIVTLKRGACLAVTLSLMVGSSLAAFAHGGGGGGGHGGGGFSKIALTS